MRRLLISLVAFAGGCAASDVPDLGPAYDDPIWSTGGKDDSSATGVVRRIDWDGFVLVPPGSDDSAVADQVRRQVKSALGALYHGPGVGLRDRDARTNLDPAGFQRDGVRIIATDGRDLGALDRVRYHYTDLALVPRSSRASQLAVPLLFDDYVARAPELIPVCSDDASAEADSLWYHYDPTMASCKGAITAEQTRIDEAGQGLSDGQIAEADSARRFLIVQAKLGPTTPARATYPEYDRLLGFGSDRQKVVVYSFFGVDADDQDPRDNGLVEEMRYLRTLRGQFPGLAVVETRPFAMLLEFTVGGQPLPGVTYEDVARWVIDGTGWPAAASDAAARQDLLAQVKGKLLERWIVWQLPVVATRGSEQRQMTVEIRMYYGREDGRPEWRQAAQWRYLEAFWNADVFSYTGHSHFGHGPLEPYDYWSGNFPERYQVMLFNSCLSYNYYDIDFLEMHPAGADDLDVVSNGLPAYWTGMGESTARYVIGLLDGTDRTWTDILRSMAVRVPGIDDRYDPMRAVTGDEGNRFDPAAGAVTITPQF